MIKYSVELENITKRFGQVVAVNNVSLRIKENEFFSLLGPSGCGKTTTLRIIAGLEKPDTGVVKLHGQDVTYIPTHKRNIGMVFQHLALFPHMDVYENIAFGLRMRGFSDNDISRRVKRMLEVVRLPGFERRKINQLSGGQQQRVALARALVMEPEVLLLDEPLGALDLKIRQEMMVELKRIQREVGTTFVYVTHDQNEAMVMSDRIAVMNEGVIQQVDSPDTIYMRPKNIFVASFIGEQINFIEGVYKGNQEFVAKGGMVLRVSDNPDAINKKSVIAIRPERIMIGDKAPHRGMNSVEGRVEMMVFKGSSIEYRISANISDEIIVFVPNISPTMKMYKIGEKVYLTWDPEAGIVLPFESKPAEPRKIG
jgi:spermidine/putrescine transport system ATP-binding protein